MPVISLEVTDQEYARLQELHSKALLVIPTQSSDTAPLTFEPWLGQVLSLLCSEPESAKELNSVRTFTAMETLVFNLHKHGFALTHTGKNPSQQTLSAQELAQSIVNDMQLQPQYVKRVQDLLTHFTKTAKELAEAAQIGLTSRAQLILIDAYRLLVERTEKALDHLGEERTIGRVEGAAAILAGLDVMDRDTAKKKTDEFKIKIRTASRAK